MKRVTGLGGLFFKAKDPKAMYDWYEKHLGIRASPTLGRHVSLARRRRPGEDRNDRLVDLSRRPRSTSTPAPRRS